MATSKRRPASPGNSRTALDRQVRREIATFLRAVHSYPESFARDPLLSFEQHLFSMANQNRAAENYRRS